MTQIRAATRLDEPGLMGVASAHEIAGNDSVQNPRYQALLRDCGRLVVADVDGSVVGFGGMIQVHGVAMITDLFVLEDHHGRGLGSAMTAALLDGYPQRMTFSSRHPAARATYAAAGMEPRWFLRYLHGGAGAAAAADTHLRAVAVGAESIVSDRPELITFFGGALLLHVLDGDDIVGQALVTDAGTHLALDRLVTTAAHDAAMTAVLRALPSTRAVEACVPEPSPAHDRLLSLGFAEIEYDLHMSSAPDLLPRHVVAVNPGLA